MMLEVKKIDGLTMEETLIKYEPMIHKLIKKATTNTVCSKEDLVQEGFTAIIKAFNCYDPSKGASFSTWVHHYISGALLDYQKNNLSTLSGGSYLQQILKKAGPAATMEELKVFHLNKSTLQAATYINANYSPADISLYKDKLIDETYQIPFEVEFFDWRQYLKEDEIFIIEKIFGFNEKNECMMKKDLCKILGISKATLNKRLQKIIQKLKETPGITAYIYW